MARKCAPRLGKPVPHSMQIPRHSVRPRLRKRYDFGTLLAAPRAAHRRELTRTRKWCGQLSRCVHARPWWISNVTLISSFRQADRVEWSNRHSDV